MATFVIGDLARIKTTFTVTEGGQLVDPTTIVLRVKNPAGTVAVYTYALGQVVRDSLGVYHYDVSTAAIGGMWVWRWEAGGAAVGAEEGEFYVSPSKVI